MNPIPEYEDCTNCTGGRYSVFDDEGDEREYECNWCGGTGKDESRRATSATPAGGKETP